MTIGVLTLTSGWLSACSNINDLVPVIDALARAAPVIASAAPVVAENLERFVPSPTPVPTPTPTPSPRGLVASVSALTLRVGDHCDLLPLLRDLDGVAPAALEVQWRVDNPAVLLMDADIGRGQAASSGQTVVTASLKGQTGRVAQFAVDVQDRRLVQEVRVQPGRLTLPPGGRRQLVAEVRMTDGQINGNVQWSSSDNTIATVNATTGEVNALREGRVTIVAAFAPDTRYKGVLELTVEAPPEPSP
jgi:hypothetical protein